MNYDTNPKDGGPDFEMPLIGGDRSSTDFDHSHATFIVSKSDGRKRGRTRQGFENDFKVVTKK